MNDWSLQRVAFQAQAMAKEIAERNARLEQENSDLRNLAGRLDENNRALHQETVRLTRETSTMQGALITLLARDAMRRQSLV